MKPLLNHYPDASMQERVEAFSTTRHGGVSTGAYAAFNINEYCGDTADDVAANRRLLARELDIDVDDIIIPHQTHGTVARVVDKAFLAAPAQERRQLLEGVDAVITCERRVCVGVSTADCIPVLLFDPDHSIVAAVHAGWRGTVARIVEKTVATMTTSLGASTTNMLAWIGPGISLDAFEVGDEVYDAFSHAGFSMPAISRRYPSADSAAADGCKWHIDLPECNRLQLLAAGLNAERVSSCGICTYGQSDDYFSARRLGVSSGRIFSGIMLK